MTSHRPGWRNGHHFALGANQPLLPILTPAASSSADLPETLSFFSISAKNAIISTIKQAEDNSGLIIRFYDTEGKENDIALSTYFDIHSAFKTNLVEENPVPVNSDTRRLDLKLGRYSIQTLKLKIKKEN